MSSRAPTRRARSSVLAALLVAAALLGAQGCRSLAVVPSSAASPTVRAPSPRRLPDRPRTDPPGPLQADLRGAIGVADGRVPDNVTVFEDDYPAVAKLEPALLVALRGAATDATNDEVTFYVDSGWRSATYQRRLFAQAVAKYGSTAQAARWVARPGTSAHELGEAIDLGHRDATVWLSRNGARYGLCQIYRDEPWHYELRAHAVGDGCPPQYADPTQDPRMRR